jgi:hypothetical protein
MTYRVVDDAGMTLHSTGVFGAKFAMYDWGFGSYRPPCWPMTVPGAPPSSKLVVKLGSTYEVNPQ